MSLRRPLAQVCRACLASSRQRPLATPHRPFASSSRWRDPDPSSNTAGSSTSPPPPLPPRASPAQLHALQASAQKRLQEARTHAQKQLRALLHSLDAGARKQAHAFAAALQALEIERKLREVGGRINQATGYEEIERLRNGVGGKERALMEAREKALLLKQAYTERVKLRADSQREVNDLLQRKSTWTGPDVLRFTELVQQEHENEREEVKAKEAMDAGEEAVEKGFSDLMQAILERYHEEQVWSDKIRSMSTYGSLAITSLNVLLFIITLLLIEPWRRRRLVANVEERLRSNSQQGHEATQSQLESMQTLLQQAQATLDTVAASTAALAAAPPPPAPAPPPPPMPELEPEPAPLPPPPPTAEKPGAAPARAQTPHGRVLEQAREAIAGNEVWAAGAAGAAGGVLLAALVSLAGR
ncbi:sensitivity to high expression protein she9 [Rhodotorula kratochvilovae]